MMHKLILGLRVVRAWITIRWRFAGIVALGVVAVAVILLIEDLVVLGLAALMLGVLVSWLAGIWVIPGGRDAYYRRVTRVLRDSLVRGRQDYYAQVKELQTITSSIGPLLSPENKENCHHEILAECEEIDGMIGGEHVGFEQMFRQIAYHRLRLLDLQKELEQSQADSSDERLATILAKRALILTEMPYAGQRLLRDQLRQLERAKPPARLEVQHRHCIETLEAYISALEDLCKAVFNGGSESLNGDWFAVASARRCEWRSLAQIYAEELRLSWVDPRREIGQVSNTR